MKTKLLALVLLLSAPLANAGMTKADYLTTRTVKKSKGNVVTVEVTIIAPKTKDAVMRFIPYRNADAKYWTVKTIKAGSGKHTFNVPGRSGWSATMLVDGRATDKETQTRKTGKGGNKLRSGGLGSSRGL